MSRKKAFYYNNKYTEINGGIPPEGDPIRVWPNFIPQSDIELVQENATNQPIVGADGEIINGGDDRLEATFEPTVTRKFFMWIVCNQTSSSAFPRNGSFANSTGSSRGGIFIRASSDYVRGSEEDEAGNEGFPAMQGNGVSNIGKFLWCFGVDLEKGIRYGNFGSDGEYTSTAAASPQSKFKFDTFYGTTEDQEITIYEVGGVLGYAPKNAQEVKNFLERVQARHNGVPFRESNI